MLLVLSREFPEYHSRIKPGRCSIAPDERANPLSAFLSPEIVRKRVSVRSPWSAPAVWQRSPVDAMAGERDTRRGVSGQAIGSSIQNLLVVAWRRGSDSKCRHYDRRIDQVVFNLLARPSPAQRDPGASARGFAPVLGHIGGRGPGSIKIGVPQAHDNGGGAYPAPDQDLVIHPMLGAGRLHGAEPAKELVEDANVGAAIDPLTKKDVYRHV